jgi:ABC-type phosphate transport system substrate-binding protein
MNQITIDAEAKAVTARPNIKEQPRVNIAKGHDHRQAKQRAWHHRMGRSAACALASLTAAVMIPLIASTPALAATTLNGVGSSFAAPAVESWQTAVTQAPYHLGINYSSTSSGDGRFEFTNQTTDFGVSDIAYGLGATDTAAPKFPFVYVPITAGGIAFMYNIPGLTESNPDAALQLTSYTACAILTGAITNWNDPLLRASGANAGSNLASLNIPIVPVTESDSAGTNYVLEEWCIQEQPALWTAFANAQNALSGGPNDGVIISATSANSNWPGTSNGLNTQTTAAVAGDVAANNGAIGAVQVKYAIDDKFGSTTGVNPNAARGVASVENASSDFTEPTPVGVASALAYATQLPDGTHKLNFSGAGKNVYNPSTYSYLLTPTTGWSASKGAVMSGFVNYVLTLGQKAAPSFGYASLGLSLEQYGIDEVNKGVPGAVALTAAEQSGYSCGDLTPAEVGAGQTAPTCGVTNTTVPIVASAGTTGTTAGTTGTTKAGTGTTAGTTGTTKTGTGTGTGTAGTGTGTGTGTAGTNQVSTAASSDGGTSATAGSGSGADPSVSLSATAPTTMASTGINAVPIGVIGGALLLVGWMVRRRLLRPRAGEPT